MNPEKTVAEWWVQNLAKIAESLTEDGWHRARDCVRGKKSALLPRKSKLLPLHATQEQCHMLLRLADLKPAGAR